MPAPRPIPVSSLESPKEKAARTAKKAGKKPPSTEKRKPPMPPYGKTVKTVGQKAAQNAGKTALKAEILDRAVKSLNKGRI